jgi:hypothetical protein
MFAKYKNSLVVFSLLGVIGPIQAFAVEVPSIGSDTEPAAEVRPASSMATIQGSASDNGQATEMRRSDAPRYARSFARASGTTTIDGRLFYNDLRDVGHFDWRRDRDGNIGGFTGYSTGGQNWLGAWYVVADFYELDSVGPSAAHPSCERQQQLGSRTINYLGEYSFTATIGDDCGPDGDVIPDIGVKFRLRFCNGDVPDLGVNLRRCFSVQNGSEQTYELWHSQASPSHPLEMSTATHTLPDGFFQSADEHYSMAASHYAALVEAMQVWHIENEVPFYYEEFGEVYVEFPSSLFTSATTTGPSRMHFPDPAEWPQGGWHEFGHVLHARAWEGSTGGCGDCPGGPYERDGNSNWSGTELEYAHTALTEGWASFVGVATQYYPDGCGTNWNSNATMRICSADANEYPQTSNFVTYPNTGKGYARNVAKMFCAWYDSMFDDDLNMAGGGDHFAATLYSTWSNLENLWDWSGGADGLDACSYVDYYLNERKSVANVGSAAHNASVELITDLIFNAGISCDYPAPN